MSSVMQREERRVNQTEVDITSTRPGTPGGRFMRQFWLAIHRSEDLPACARAPRVMDLVHDVWAGQGRIADRSNERLGRSDTAIIVWRKILARELRAIAEGRPAKRWSSPPADVLPIIGV